MFCDFMVKGQEKKQPQTVISQDLRNAADTRVFMGSECSHFVNRFRLA